MAHSYKETQLLLLWCLSFSKTKIKNPTDCHFYLHFIFTSLVGFAGAWQVGSQH